MRRDLKKNVLIESSAVNDIQVSFYVFMFFQECFFINFFFILIYFFKVDSGVMNY